MRVARAAMELLALVRRLHPFHAFEDLRSGSEYMEISLAKSMEPARDPLQPSRAGSLDDACALHRRAHPDMPAVRGRADTGDQTLLFEPVQDA